MYSEVEHWTYELESPFRSPQEILGLVAAPDVARVDELEDDEASVYESLTGTSELEAFEWESVGAEEADLLEEEQFLEETGTPGSPIPIPVPTPCVQVPTLPGPDRRCQGVNSAQFAGIAGVAAFAGQVADCYANRMAARRQRERHAKAQAAAEKRASAVRPRLSRAQVAAARAAVQPEPIDAVRTDIRARYLAFLETEFRDTIIGAANRWGTKCALNDIARKWMFGVREQLDFVTRGTAGRSLGRFEPPPRPAGGDQLVAIEPPATASGGARVQPIMNTFLRELRRRAARHRASNYPNHGGSRFNGRGYSIDLYLDDRVDDRGFYPRPAAVRFLLDLDAAARAAGVEWRAIYNDHAVASAVNRHLDRRRVIFVGQLRRGGRRIGLNWHGPLILHFHVDITPRPSALTGSGEDAWVSTSESDEFEFEDQWAADPEQSESSEHEYAQFDDEFESDLETDLEDEFEHEFEDEFESDLGNEFDEEFEFEAFDGDEVDAGVVGEVEPAASARVGEFLLESAVADRAAAMEAEPGAEAFDEAAEEFGQPEFGDREFGEREFDDEQFGDEQFAEEEFDVAFEEFTGSEHKTIGDAGSRNAKTAIVYGPASTPMTFGDVVALAGDMYGSYYDLAERSRTPEGRAELAWARWKALSLPKANEPRVAAAVQDRVMDRYYSLAAENISHFSAGGTGAEHYMKWHAAAMTDAFGAGQSGNERQWRIALGKEAFGDHFLTDVFSSGHVRTPRADIKAWYQKHGFGSSTPFVKYMAAFMHAQLRSRNPLLQLPIVSGFALGVVEKKVKLLGGEALQSFSLGDILSLALHDYDNSNGLFVVSKVDPSGRKVTGGHRWRAMGDSHLLDKSGQGKATQQMATAAVAASFRDLGRVREAGRRIGQRSLSAPAQTQLIKQALKGVLFPALDYIPKEDATRTNKALTTSSGRAPLEWRWGQLGSEAAKAVDDSVKGEIASQMAAKAQGVQDPAKGPLGIEIHGTRPALEAFVKHLRSEGIRALEKAVGQRAR